VVIIALWEEIVSRGYIQTRLQKAWGLWGVVIATLLFALLHLPSALAAGSLPEAAVRFLQTGLSGFVLSYLYWETRSVLPTIFLHGLRNSAGQRPCKRLAGPAALRPRAFMGAKRTISISAKATRSVFVRRRRFSSM